MILYRSFCVIKKHRQIGNHVKCFCGIQKTDLQFNENSQGNLKQEEFLYLQLLVHSYEIYYVWQNVLYCIFMLYKVVVHFTQRSFSLLFCKQKANWRRNVCNKTIPFIYICCFYCLRNFFSRDFMIVNASTGSTDSPQNGVKTDPSKVEEQQQLMQTTKLECLYKE